MFNTSTTTNSSKTSPFTKRGDTVIPVLDTLETEKKDTFGFFEETSSESTFNANSGGQILFNLNRTDIPQAFQKASENDASTNLDQTTAPVSELFKDGAAVTFGAVKTGAGALGNILKDTFGAIADVVKTDVAFETPKEQRPGANSEQAEAAEKKAVEVQYVNQVQKEIEDQISIIRRKMESEANLASLKQEISKLTGLPEWLEGIVTEKNEARTDLVAAMALTRKDILAKQSSRAQGISSASKRGGQGIDLNANKAGETSGGNSNAQNAVG